VQDYARVIAKVIVREQLRSPPPGTAARPTQAEPERAFISGIKAGGLASGELKCASALLCADLILPLETSPQYSHSAAQVCHE
jgi:hypothetical protein